MTTTVAVISIGTALVYLALLGLLLTVAGWIGGRLFRQSSLTFLHLLPIGMVQGLVAGFSVLMTGQVLQISPFASALITIVLMLLVGLGELHLALRTPWKAALKPWAVMSAFQVVLGIPAALLLSILLSGVLNVIFPA